MPNLSKYVPCTPANSLEPVTRDKLSNNFPLMRGIVEDNVDPKGIGRVRVRINSLNGTFDKGCKTEDLPWASVCSLGASYNSGSFITPEVGTTVFVSFEDGNPDRPVVIGGCYGTGTETGKKVGDTDGDYRYQRLGKKETPDEASTVRDKVIYKSPKGASIVINDNGGSESITISDQLGQSIKLTTPIKSDTKMAGYESMDKKELLDGKANIIITGINGSVISLDSDNNNATMTANILGENAIKIVASTVDGLLSLLTKKYSLNAKEALDLIVNDAILHLANNVARLTNGTGSIEMSGGTTVVKSGGGTINMSGSLINLEAPNVRVNSRVIRLR